MRDSLLILSHQVIRRVLNVNAIKPWRKVRGSWGPELFTGTYQVTARNVD